MGSGDILLTICMCSTHLTLSILSLVFKETAAEVAGSQVLCRIVYP